MIEGETKSLHFLEIDNLRKTKSKSLLLFLTDRCPVGCAHCSVDSRINSPTITDRVLFREILNGISSMEQLELVGISGGEPFVEKWGLIEAVNTLHNAGKAIALYTSGIWARKSLPNKWIKEVLSKCTCIFLSTDLFHQNRIETDTFVSALRVIKESGVWIIVQVLDNPSMIEHATSMLENALGLEWINHAEIRKIPPLPYGRGKDIFTLNERRKLDEFGTCSILASPVIRYDGTVTSCCNENVIMGNGPSRLRNKIRNKDDLIKTFGNLEKDEINQLIRTIGMNQLFLLPPLRDLRQKITNQRFSSICDLCWKLQDHMERKPLDYKWSLFTQALISRDNNHDYDECRN